MGPPVRGEGLRAVVQDMRGHRAKVPAGGKDQPGDDRFLRGGLRAVQAAVQAHGRGEPAHRHDLQGRREGRAHQSAAIRLQELRKDADGLCRARVTRLRGARVVPDTTTVENATKHLLGHRDHKNIPRKLDGGIPVINTFGTLEHLNNSLGSVYFKNLPTTLATVAQSKLNNLTVTGLLDVFKNDQRPLDAFDGLVLNARLYYEITLHRIQMLLDLGSIDILDSITEQ